LKPSGEWLLGLIDAQVNSGNDPANTLLIFSLEEMT